MSKRIIEGKAGKIAARGKKKKKEKGNQRNPSVNQDISVHIQPGYVPSLQHNYDFCE